MLSLPPGVVYTQGCRWDYLCKKTGKYNTTDSKSHCLHNGGTDCPTWKRLTNKSIEGTL